ncbi:NAD(P)H-binding protein [Paraflavisolibacter sp. H34]|uniref:NAD(P)H-binding protein n=1 Tax=Huijunlia imazamoxiresistens TaxID=3127457 RepID=UPI0030190615
MKYVITGGAGNISKPLAATLLAAGHEVTVIGRSAENLASLVALGARAAIGTVEDAAFLAQAFAGADAVYTMVPPQYAALGLDDYQQVGARYAEAIRVNHIRYVVNLSSVGAHLPAGVGPVSGLYRVEQELNKLSDTHVLHLRPGFFYSNFFGNIGMIKGLDLIGGNYGDSNARMVLSHPADIAAAAARELTELSFRGQSVRYLASDERTTGDVARVLGAAVGKPALPWVAFTDEQAQGGLAQAGLPPTMVDKYVEMGQAIRTGIMWEDFLQQRPQQFGATRLEDFAPAFAAAYGAG